MADVAAVLHAVKAHQLQPCIGPVKGPIEVRCLGDLGQHPSAAGHHTTILLASRSGMEQLPLIIGIRLQIDYIPFAWCLRCLLYTSPSPRD